MCRCLSAPHTILGDVTFVFLSLCLLSGFLLVCSALSFCLHSPISLIRFLRLSGAFSLSIFRSCLSHYLTHPHWRSVYVGPSLTPLSCSLSLSLALSCSLLLSVALSCLLSPFSSRSHLVSPAVGACNCLVLKQGLAMKERPTATSTSEDSRPTLTIGICVSCLTPLATSPAVMLSVIRRQA